jgi:hypothetical protein
MQGRDRWQSLNKSIGSHANNSNNVNTQNNEYHGCQGLKSTGLCSSMSKIYWIGDSWQGIYFQRVHARFITSSSFFTMIMIDRRFPWRTEERHEKLQPRDSIPRTRFETRTCSIRSTTDNTQVVKLKSKGASWNDGLSSRVKNKISEMSHDKIQTIIFINRIWGSHGGEYEDCCLLGCSTV